MENEQPDDHHGIPAKRPARKLAVLPGKRSFESGRGISVSGMKKPGQGKPDPGFGRSAGRAGKRHFFWSPHHGRNPTRRTSRLLHNSHRNASAIPPITAPGTAPQMQYRPQQPRRTRRRSGTILTGAEAVRAICSLPAIPPEQSPPHICSPPGNAQKLSAALPDRPHARMQSGGGTP